MISKLARRLLEAPKPQELAPPLPAPADVTDLSIKRVGPVREEILPKKTAEELIPEIREREGVMSPMPEPSLMRDALNQSLRTQAYDAIDAGGTQFGMNTCVGRFSSVSNNGTKYLGEVNFHNTPDGFYEEHGRYPVVFKETRAERTRTLVLEGPKRDGFGRAQGTYGWSDDRDLVAFIDANPRTLNATLLMMGYFDRPSIPCTDSIRVPNHEVGQVLDQILFPVSYSYNNPSPVITYQVKVNSPTDGKLGLDLWNSNKERAISEPQEIEFSEGRSIITLAVIGPPASGYLNVNPLDAPEGLTVTEVRTVPPCL